MYSNGDSPNHAGDGIDNIMIGRPGRAIGYYVGTPRTGEIRNAFTIDGAPTSTPYPPPLPIADIVIGYLRFLL